MPKVSIVTPCYNSANYLQKTYEGIVQQDCSDWEWLVTDDCSQDASYEILQELAAKDSRVKVFRNEVNSGASVSRNKGIDESKGDYIAFLDADDFWESHKLSRQLQFMQQNDVQFSYHDFKMVDTEGRKIKDFICPKKLNLTDIEKFNPIFTSSVMIKRDLTEGSRFKPHLRRRQDYVYWHDLLKKCEAYNVGENLGSYRTGDAESLSSNKVRNIKIQWKIYRNEFNMGVLKSTKALLAYGIHGIKKYFF